jgi:hypothetical protein
VARRGRRSAHLAGSGERVGVFAAASAPLWGVCGALEALEGSEAALWASSERMAK